MYEVNCVYAPAQPKGRVIGPVRLLEVVPNKQVVLIHVQDGHPTAPFVESLDTWNELFDEDQIDAAPDPYASLTSVPAGLPPGATQRLAKANQVISSLLASCSTLSKPRQLAAAIAKAATEIDRSKKTAKRWIHEWLRSGRNTASIAKTFVEDENRELTGQQVTGRKRGPKSAKPELASTVSASDVREKIDKAYDSYVKEQGMTWRDAYGEMLIVQFKVPRVDLITDEGKGILLTPGLIEKYGIPSWYQFRNRCRRLQRKETEAGTELPRGSRGRAVAPGPGFFEIDATHFQIQLVSVLTKAELVGRPTVYLIVDIFSGAITGYTVTLENPSWAVAAIALFNCFSDKAATFKRLGLPFTTADWISQQLPTVLRADRAELVSNMGQQFPLSGIRVNVTPSMVPEAKGSVEGKNSEMKRPTFSRFNLPGLFKKYRKRREKDGKKSAVLNIIQFERILVEIILDLNMKPVRPTKLPPDAVMAGGKAASRIGLYEWGLKNRPGFTGNMGSNFVYEHLLTQGTGVVTPLGVLFDGELFQCDRLRELGFLATAVAKKFPVRVAFNPLFAGEVFLFDKERNSYFAAANVDAGIVRACASFAEAKEQRAGKGAVIEQASINHYARRRDRVAVVKADIRDAKTEKAGTPALPAASKDHIRDARARDKSLMRGAGLNGSLPQDQLTTGSALPAADPVSARPEPGDQRPMQPSNAAASVRNLWSQVDAVSK